MFRKRLALLIALIIPLGSLALTSHFFNKNLLKTDPQEESFAQLGDPVVPDVPRLAAGPVAPNFEEPQRELQKADSDDSKDEAEEDDTEVVSNAPPVPAHPQDPFEYLNIQEIQETVADLNAQVRSHIANVSVALGHPQVQIRPEIFIRSHSGKQLENAIAAIREISDLQHIEVRQVSAGQLPNAMSLRLYEFLVSKFGKSSITLLVAPPERSNAKAAVMINLKE